MDPEVVMMTTKHQAQSPAADAGRSRVRHIVVGYDGSPTSKEALTWAAAEAGDTKDVLTVVQAGAAWTGGFSSPVLDDVAAAGRRLAEEGADLAREVRSGADPGRVKVQAVLQDPTAALLKASRDADLVVVGSRGRGRVAGALLGSVAYAVSSRATCPVVVVRGHAERHPGPEAPVVVGVDDSEGSHDAVRFAADVAARRGARLVVLAAWTLPDVTALDGYGSLDIPAMVDSVRAGASAGADAAVALARSQHPDLEGDTRIVEDRPATALADASSEAGLVVVGARGRGALGSLFLGSVSHATVHQASCPVAVVRRREAP